jgi:AcrR family transcriptional regulator
MPAAQATRGEIVEKLFTVFRDQGFEGASITDLSRATGLGKSSLYHHFPEGKGQMAEAVLEFATAVIDSEILGSAQAGGTLKNRIRKIVATLDQMYSGGRASCVLGQLATSNLGDTARRGLMLAFAHWIEAIKDLAQESGMTAVKAEHFAQDWVARLQGALLLQAANGDLGPYKRAMGALLELSKEG